jgi:hypothetical protein
MTHARTWAGWRHEAAPWAAARVVEAKDGHTIKDNRLLRIKPRNLKPYKLPRHAR